MSVSKRKWESLGDVTDGQSGTDHYSTPAWLLELLFPDGRCHDPCPLGGLAGSLTDAWPTDIPVFINPPYSNPRPWLEKAAGHKGEVVALVKADPSSSWWDLSEGFKVTFIGQRLRFGGTRLAAPFPSAIWRRSSSTRGENTRDVREGGN